jgi:hypothetical protein
MNEWKQPGWGSDKREYSTDIFSSSADKLHQKRVKQEYKSRAEVALDNSVRLYNEAKVNGYEDFEIGNELKSPVIRYYRKYWLDDMIMLMIIVSVITFLTSFYTPLASIGYFALIATMWGYGEKNFLKFYLKDFEMKIEEEDMMLEKIFSSVYNPLFYGVLVFIFVLASYIALYFSTNLWLNLPDNFVEWLSVKFEFYPSHEIYAYTNLILMLGLVATKSVKRFRR